MVAEANFAGSRIMRYGIRPFAVAGFFVYLTSLCTLLLQQIFPYPFLFVYIGAVMGSAWFGGAIAGAISVALSTVIIAFFFVPPYYSFAINSVALPYFISFVVCAALVSWASSYRRRAENAIRDSRDLLELRVQERTAELEHSNRELKQSDRELRELTEAIPQQIWRADSDGSIQYCNSHLLRFIGRSQLEVHGNRFFDILHPEDLQSFTESWAAARETGTSLEGEWRVACEDGTYRWFMIRSIAQRSADGNIGYWYGTHIDMEDWKRAELALAASQLKLAHATRVLSMAEVAASIAHEINQPLTAIVTHSYACLGWLKESNLQRAQATTEKIIQEGTHAGAIVQRIRALFLKDEPIRSLESMNRIILDTLRLLRDESVRRHIRLRALLGNHLPLVSVDRVQIQQVLLNLILNGFDAMEGHGSAPGPMAELVVQSSIEEAGAVLIRVVDRGQGIEPDIAANIFEAFFTTKSTGLGMGLSISRTIVEGHDGKLWAAANPEGGSILQFSLPVSR